MSTSVPLGLQQCKRALLNSARRLNFLRRELLRRDFPFEKNCHHERCKERTPMGHELGGMHTHTAKKFVCVVYTTKGMQQHPALSWPASRYGGGGFIYLKYIIFFPSLYLSNIGRACIPNERT